MNCKGKKLGWQSSLIKIKSNNSSELLPQMWRLLLRTQPLIRSKVVGGYKYDKVTQFNI